MWNCGIGKTRAEQSPAPTVIWGNCLKSGAPTVIWGNCLKSGRSEPCPYDRLGKPPPYSINIIFQKIILIGRHLPLGARGGISLKGSLFVKCLFECNASPSGINLLQRQTQKTVQNFSAPFEILFGCISHL